MRTASLLLLSGCLLMSGCYEGTPKQQGPAQCLAVDLSPGQYVRQLQEITDRRNHADCEYVAVIREYERRAKGYSVTPFPFFCPESGGTK